MQLDPEDEAQLPNAPVLSPPRHAHAHAGPTHSHTPCTALTPWAAESDSSPRGTRLRGDVTQPRYRGPHVRLAVSALRSVGPHAPPVQEGVRREQCPRQHCPFWGARAAGRGRCRGGLSSVRRPLGCTCSWRTDRSYYLWWTKAK